MGPGAKGRARPVLPANLSPVLSPLEPAPLPSFSAALPRSCASEAVVLLGAGGCTLRMSLTATPPLGPPPRPLSRPCYPLCTPSPAPAAASASPHSGPLTRSAPSLSHHPLPHHAGCHPQLPGLAASSSQRFPTTPSRKRTPGLFSFWFPKHPVLLLLSPLPPTVQAISPPLSKSLARLRPGSQLFGAPLHCLPSS